MRTKICKVTSDLNIAVATAVEFLRKHNIEVNGGPNDRIDQNAVDLLLTEFHSDRTIKSRAKRNNTESSVRLPPKNATIHFSGPKIIEESNLHNTDTGIDTDIEPAHVAKNVVSCSSSRSETASKEKVIREFDVLSVLHRKAIDSVSSAKVKHKTLSSIQKSFLNELKNVLLEIQTKINELRKEIVWDHLVVGFFGETNAGKSTTIETLRLKYGKGKRNWVHGAIVGDGQADFTKDASEYELDLNGKHVTLIDIPGIEGDESKYADIIKKALRRAHYVFYVHCKRQQPDEKIASRIKEYLADWTQVYSIMNVSGRPGSYDEPEERVTLLTS